MTRINSDLNPVLLTDQHLMAEYRELPMVYSSLRRSMCSKNWKNTLKTLPHEFTLNKGHVKFFYNKLTFLQSRYQRLIVELKHRNYNLDDSRIFDLSEFPEHLHNDWSSTKKDDDIVIERICLRLNEKPTVYRYNGKNIIVEDFISEYYRQYT